MPKKKSNPDACLIAPCGMNCGICMAYLRERNKCPGCRGSDARKTVTRVQCKIKNCTALRKGTSFCFQCAVFPCDLLKRLDKRYRTKYHMSMIGNLENIAKSGMRKFIRSEKIRWTCPACGGTVCVHKGCCRRCGNRFPKQFEKAT